MGVSVGGGGGSSLLRAESLRKSTEGGRYSLQKLSTFLMVLVDVGLSPPALSSTKISVRTSCLGTGLRGMTSTCCTKLLISFCANSSALSGERKRDLARRGDAIFVKALCLPYRRIGGRQGCY